MKHFLFVLMALAALLPMQAKADVGEMLGGLLQLGGQVLEDHSKKAKEATPAPGNKEPGPAEQIVFTIRTATDTLLESYKEQGKEYAREVGDIITQRIMEDKKINSTMDSMRLFCWAVIIYLTVVTLIVLYMLLRLRVLYAQIMNKLDKN